MLPSKVKQRFSISSLSSNNTNTNFPKYTQIINLYNVIKLLVRELLLCICLDNISSFNR